MLVDGSPSYLAVQLPERVIPNIVTRYPCSSSGVSNWSLLTADGGCVIRVVPLKFLAEHWDELDCNFAAEFFAWFPEAYGLCSTD